jgi:glycosyltransferase involved in cell wall biosynthesis
MSGQPKHDLFVFLGRRGAISRWVPDITGLTTGRAAVVVSRQNEIYNQIRNSGPNIVKVDTFDSVLGAIRHLPRIFSIRRKICNLIRTRGVTRVVILMSHIWTPFLARAVRNCGAQYVVIVHDAVPHPGDISAMVHWWLIRDALKADKVITLSRHVAGELIKRYPNLRERVEILFHPLLGTASSPDRSVQGRPLKFLFFGRLLQYKGLPLFVEACEILRREKLNFEFSVIGEGNLGYLRKRLEASGAEIVNRWVGEGEISAVMERHDVVVVSSTEASQSGVITVAFGAGRPVIATPVGGMSEQIDDGRTGILAQSVSPEAIAHAMRRLICDPSLLATLTNGARELQDQYSMSRFLGALDSIAADSESGHSATAVDN